jgi:hypothetical protein
MAFAVVFVMPVPSQLPPISDSQKSSPTDLSSADLTSAALIAALSAETGLPPGRVHKVLAALQRHLASPGAPTAATIGNEATSVDPLRFYPIGANGRLRPPGGRAG